MKFFLDAGIPPDNAAQYAVTFESNRMGLDMLMDLDKEYLRDLNITALGDIISILKYAKSASVKTAADQVLKSDSGKPLGEESKSQILTKVSKSVSTQKQIESKPKKESSTVSSRLGPQVLPPIEDCVLPDPVKSVFSRLGDQQNNDSQEEFKVKSESKTSSMDSSSKRPLSGSIFERLGPEAEGVERQPSPQESRVTSTTETVVQPARGILKKRGMGDGVGLAKSKSASNIISLKPPAFKDMKKKRISFGENEIKTMDPKPDIKSRLGYGKCKSPPPPEISEPVLKTEIKKIAIGGGKFEMKKVMKIVNADKTIASELGRTSPAVVSLSMNEIQPPKMENLTIAVKNDIQKDKSNDIKKLKIAIKNDYKIDDYKMDKVDLALRAAKLKVAIKQSRGNDSDSMDEPRPKKRLAKYITKEDGTVEKEYIGYDDPILETLPIKKKKSEDLDHMIKKTEELKMKSLSRSPVIINKDRVATNFQVVRPSSNQSQSSLYSDSHITLAQKAAMVRTKQETFKTLASKATDLQKKSLSPEAVDSSSRSGKTSGARMDERKLSLKARLDDSKRSSEDNYTHEKLVKDKVASGDRNSVSVRDRVGHRDLSPMAVQNRVGSRDRSPASVRDRIGSGERSPGYSDRSRSRERLGSSGQKKIFSRLGPRD